MKQVRGDLIKMALAGDFDVIVHGCNCQRTMGSGIAKQIREMFPEAYEIDLAGERKPELGSIRYVHIPRVHDKFFVVNAYTQFGYGVNKRQVSYAAVGAAFTEIARVFCNGQRIAYPMIGAGLGGGYWSIISAIIDDALGLGPFGAFNHTLVRYEP